MKLPGFPNLQAKLHALFTLPLVPRILHHPSTRVPLSLSCITASTKIDCPVKKSTKSWLSLLQTSRTSSAYSRTSRTGSFVTSSPRWSGHHMMQAIKLLYGFLIIQRTRPFTNSPLAWTAPLLDETVTPMAILTSSWSTPRALSGQVLTGGGVYKSLVGNRMPL